MVDQEIRVLGDENIIANPKNSQKQYPLTFKAVPNVIVYGRKKADLNFTVPITEGTNFNFNLERTAIIFSDSFNLEEYSYIMVKNPFEEISDFFYVSSLEELDPTGKEFNEFNDEVVKWLRRLVNIISNRCMIFETTLFKDLNNFPNIKSGQTFIRTEDGWTGITIRDINSELDLIFNKYVEEINKKIQEHQTQMNELLEQWKQDIQKYAENVKQYEIVRVVTQTGHGFVFEPVMYSISQRKFVKAVFPHGADGVAVRVDDNNFRLVWVGRVEIPSTAKDTQQRDFVLGEYYFLGEGSNGGIQREKPDTYYQHLFQVMYSDELRQNIADVLLSVPINQKGKRWDIGEAKTTVNDIEELKMSDFPVGKVVEVLGYYKAGDGAGHKRIIKAEDDGSGVQLSNNLWANIVHNGEVNVSWFGAKSSNNAKIIDGVFNNQYEFDNNDIFQKIKNYNCDVIKFPKGRYYTSKGNFFARKTKYIGENRETTIIFINGELVKVTDEMIDDYRKAMDWVSFENLSLVNCSNKGYLFNLSTETRSHMFRQLKIIRCNLYGADGIVGSDNNSNERTLLWESIFYDVAFGCSKKTGVAIKNTITGPATKFILITEQIPQHEFGFLGECLFEDCSPLVIDLMNTASTIKYTNLENGRCTIYNSNFEDSPLSIKGNKTNLKLENCKLDTGVSTKEQKFLSGTFSRLVINNTILKLYSVITKTFDCVVDYNGLSINNIMVDSFDKSLFDNKITFDNGSFIDLNITAKYNSLDIADKVIDMNSKQGNINLLSAKEVNNSPHKYISGEGLIIKTNQYFSDYEYQEVDRFYKTKKGKAFRYNNNDIWINYLTSYNSETTKNGDWFVQKINSTEDNSGTVILNAQLSAPHKLPEVNQIPLPFALEDGYSVILKKCKVQGVIPVDYKIKLLEVTSKSNGYFQFICQNIDGTQYTVLDKVIDCVVIGRVKK